MIRLKEINLKNIWFFNQGWFRYWVYYKGPEWLLRKHIREQIDVRIASMDRECYNSGSCKICGCATTALQMSDKACEKPCYPAMLNKYLWNNWIKKKKIQYCAETKRFWLLKDGKFRDLINYTNNT